MTIGLTGEQIVKKLEEQGITGGDLATTDTVIKAIAIAIEENNKALENGPNEPKSNKVSTETLSMLYRKGSNI